MTNDDRPDPDQLLRAIARHDVTGPSGKLSIFFGMSAGVGKTYAMLSAARAMRAGGSDVVIGLVETHGRSETAALAAGLEVIPRKAITYRGASFEEMDLDALLGRRPQLAIVDELAHTNVPGARHPKRWQDVVELLEAGIDVYTTVNVQHIESRKALVEAIGGITVRETVPDAILEGASAIELVDITPAELLKRLGEGKVYLGEKAEAAAANFFHEDRLTALRELALRLTAEKVDSDLHDLIATGGGDESWKPAERLMVAVSHSPYSAGLIRATRRIAFGLSAPWLAVYVDTGAALSPDDRATLAMNLQLVQELGGELVSTSDIDIPEALERIARQRGVTQLVVGRPTRRWRDLISGGTILDQLARRNAGYDILVLRPEPGSKVTYSRRTGDTVGRFTLRPYSLACGTVVVIALLNWLMLPVIGYKAGGFLFLLSVLGVSLFVTFGAVAVTAILSALVWDYFFIPPYGTLHMSQADDVMMVCSYFVAALVTGTLAHRIQTRQRLIRQREERTEILYDLTKSLAAQIGIRGVMTALAEKLHSLLQGEVDLICTGGQGDLLSKSVLERRWLQEERERAVAQWAYEHGKSAGWATDTLPASSARYLPISGGSGTAFGVLAFRPDSDRRLTQDEENLLSAVAHQLALSLERERLREEAQETDRLRESERLLQTVMDSVSHELRTPLTAISGTASALSADEVVTDPIRRRQLTEELLAMTERLNRVVGNLLDMSRLSSGVMSLQKDWHDPLDIVSAALDITRRETANHEVRLESGDELPLVRVDFHLMAQAVANVICNAATYAPKGTCIEIACRCAGGRVKITVSDRGPGIAADVMPMIFAKFYRGSGARAGGVGLGLAITKAIVEVHGGSVTVTNRPSGGACFVIDLPVETQPEIPPEMDAQ
jgi:two-component system, OmpR family, sensor histidine kinase KdpD